MKPRPNHRDDYLATFKLQLLSITADVRTSASVIGSVQSCCVQCDSGPTLIVWSQLHNPGAAEAVFDKRRVKHPIKFQRSVTTTSSHQGVIEQLSTPITLSAALRVPAAAPTSRRAEADQ